MGITYLRHAPSRRRSLARRPNTDLCEAGGAPIERALELGAVAARLWLLRRAERWLWCAATVAQRQAAAVARHGPAVVRVIVGRVIEVGVQVIAVLGDNFGFL